MINPCFTFLRHGGEGDAQILVALNFTPVVRYDYKLGVPIAGHWQECLNSDAETYWGSGVGNMGAVNTTLTNRRMASRAHFKLTIPPLGCSVPEESEASEENLQMTDPRIISLIASATEIVCALGAEKWLVGDQSRMRLSGIGFVAKNTLYKFRDLVGATERRN